MISTRRQLWSSPYWFIATILILLAVPFWVESAVNEKVFRFYDATLFSEKPDLLPYGLETLKVVYESDIWGSDDDHSLLPSPERIRKIASGFGQTEIICLDIERWLRKTELPANRAESRYIKALHAFRSAGKGFLKIGFYGIPPVRDYWRAIASPDSQKFRSWQDENKQYTRLGAEVDVIFPSLYTFYRDPSGWQRYAQAQINAARIYGKPVYVFLWPMFHDSNRALGGQYIGDHYWHMQLETAYRLADGLVIWGGWGKEGRQSWDPDARWWVIVRRFIETNRTYNR